MSSYREVRRETAEKMGDEKHPPLPCMTCREDTPRATLSTYGARCIRCYHEYCAAAFKGTPGIKPKPISSALKRLNAGSEADDENRRRDSQERQAQAVREYAEQKGLAL